MGSFDDAMASAENALLASFGESVTYTPATGPIQTVAAIVDRGQLSPVREVGGKVGATHAVLTISRADIADIARGDSFSFADTQGGEARAHADVQIDKARTDGAFWVLIVR